MTFRRTPARIATLALCSLTPFAAIAADCTPAPLGDTVIYLRGGLNSWVIDDDYAFAYRCDAYYLNVNASGQQEFKIADAAWSPGATFAAGASTVFDAQGQAPLARGSDPGNTDNVRFRFNGDHTLRLAFRDGRAQLQVGPKSYTDPGARVLDNPVALSLSHDSRNARDKAPFGSVVAGTPMQFAINAAAGAEGVTLVIEKRRLEGNQQVLEYSDVARIPMRKEAGGSGERWRSTYQFDAPGVYGYYFEARIGGQVYQYQNNRNTVYWTREKGSNGVGVVQYPGTSTKNIRRFRQTVYAADYKVPGWARDAVYYYIFPERFRNGDTSNDPKPGVDTYQDKGVEFHANWLDKPYRPGSGDGSDAISNNDFFGGDLQGIIEKLDYIKSLGANTIYMTPIFTAASNHKYDTADYRNIDPHFGSNDDFVRLAREAKRRGIRVMTDASFNHTGSDSIYFDRFAKYPSVGAFEGAHVTPASPYASWYSFDAAQKEANKQYKGWEGTADLPELNKMSPAWRSFAYAAPDSVTRLWLQRGASGWRMDVAPWVPDDFWREWRKVVKAQDSEALTISETWFDASKFFLGDTFDSTMNYIFRNAVLDYASGAKASQMYQNIELMREAYPAQSFYALMNLLSTHDAARSLHVLGDTESPALARQRYRLAVFFQMMFPGAPAVYYGDEVGLSGGDDPANRAAYPWADRGGKPDLGMLAEFKRLTAMRHKHKVLRHGSIDAPLLLDEHLVVLARKDGKTWAVCATNNAGDAKTVTVSLPAGAPRRYRDALDGRTLTADKGKLTLTVPSMYGVVLVSQ